MPDTVLKIGGSGLRRSADLQRVLKVIQSYSKPVVIVVSAFYGLTDHLEKMLYRTRTQGDHIPWLSDFLQDLKQHILESNIRDAALRREIGDKLSERVSTLERYLTGVYYIGDIPPFVEDLVLSYGERLSSLLLSEYLKHEGIACREILPEDMGLTSDGEFRNASVDLKASAEPVRKALSEEVCYVVPGFYAVSPEKRVTLLGRGGSDYSAAAIARCINARSLDIWKDVKGFMSADPKIVQNALHVEKLSYTEAAELAYFGARILHPRTVEPLMDSGIPIRIFNIEDPDHYHSPYTTVSANGVVRKGQILKSVTYSDDFAILKLKGPGVGAKPGILARSTTELDHQGINIKSVITSQTSINFLLDKKDISRANQALHHLNLHAVSSIELRQDLCLIAVVGEGMLEQHGIAALIFSAVSRRNINIRLISVGASQVAAYFIIDSEDKNNTLMAIHELLEN